MYRLDCVSHSASRCRVDPSVPFRRVAQSASDIDVDADGAARAASAERTRALSAIPYLVSYSHGLLLALWRRVLIMLLTAAVVFVRGNQDATSNKYMLVHARETMTRARAGRDAVVAGAELVDRGRRPGHHGPRARRAGVVLGFSARTLLADGLTSVVVFEALGGAASLVHIALRVGALERNFKRAVEAPLTKLAGPMSLVDVSAAVLPCSPTRRCFRRTTVGSRPSGGC